MRAARLIWGTLSLAVLAATVTAVAISSARAQTPSAPTLVSATILANNYKEGELSTVQYTFNEPVTLPNGDSGVGAGTPDTAASDLSKFTLSSGVHPVSAVVEANRFIVEANFRSSVNVGLFEHASAKAGAVVSSPGNVPSGAGSTGLMITAEGSTAAPDLTGADVFNDLAAEGAPALPSRADQIEFYFDKPIESVVAGDFGYYPPGSTVPIMGTSVEAGGFTPGTTSVTIAFPGTPGIAASGIFALRGAATESNGLPSPVQESLNDGSGPVAGMPGLLSASGEYVASITRVSTTKYDFTFNEAPTTVDPADFLLYTFRDGQFQGSADTVSGQTVEVTFPGITRKKHVVLGSVLPGAVTVGGIPNNVGSQAIGSAAGFFTGTNANRGVGFTRTGPSIKSSPASIRDAACAAGDHPETGLQGQVPPDVRAAGFKGYNCNLTELGQYPAAGATWAGGTWVGAWAGHCAYLATAGSGVIVIDASDPAHPVMTGMLTIPAFLNPWETLKYNPRRHLLAATSFENSWFGIYDVSNCAHPVLDASVDLGPIAKGHEGNWAPDGNTYYSATDYVGGIGDRMIVIDTKDPHNPKVLTELSFPAGEYGRSHGLSLNSSGTILYVNQAGSFGHQGNPRGPNGLVTLNVSQIQHRVPNPKVSVISTLFWNDSNIGQETLPVTYKGQHYLVTTDEIGSGGIGTGGRAGACARGLSPFGFARIINVNDPRHPFIVSKLRLQVDVPTKCDINDDAPNTVAFGYDSHYCNVNRTSDPTMLGCGQFESGMRLYDIANPRKPSEIGYFNPPPGDATASEHGVAGEKTGTDWASSPPVFVGCDVWDQFQDNGYIFMKITHGPGKRLCKVDSTTANSNLQ